MPARAEKAAPAKPAKHPAAAAAKGSSKAASARPDAKKPEKKPVATPPKAASKPAAAKGPPKTEPVVAQKVVDKGAPRNPNRPAPDATARPPSAKAQAASAKGSVATPQGQVPEGPFTLKQGLLDAFATSNRINRFLIENITDDAWRARPLDGKGRTIASIVAHIHNVRVMWLQAAAPNAKIPEQLDKSTVTRKGAVRALEESHLAIERFVGPALTGDGAIPKFPAGVAGFISYLMTHDAHHRGQMCMMARQVGKSLTQETMFGMWEWSKR